MSVTGWIDRVDETKVAGWAHSYEHPSRSEWIEVVINGVLVVQVLAQRERPDLRGHQITFSRKGFELTLTDFTEKAVNTVEFIHAESRERIGAERYLLFSTQAEVWARASEADIARVRGVFEAERSFYNTPTSGSWEREPDFAPLAAAVLQAGGPTLPAKLSLLQVRAPSISFAKALATAKRLGRLGVADSAEQLRDWHAEASKNFARAELYESAAEAGRPWDIVLMPMLHERSGPSFVDVLKYSAGILSERGIVVFDIQSDTTSDHGYLLSHDNKLLRISTVVEATAEVERAGLRTIATLDFVYVPGSPDTARTVLVATRMNGK